MLVLSSETKTEVDSAKQPVYINIPEINARLRDLEKRLRANCCGTVDFLLSGRSRSSLESTFAPPTFTLFLCSNATVRVKGRCSESTPAD